MLLEQTHYPLGNTGSNWPAIIVTGIVVVAVIMVISSKPLKPIKVPIPLITDSDPDKRKTDEDANKKEQLPAA